MAKTEEKVRISRKSKIGKVFLAILLIAIPLMVGGIASVLTISAQESFNKLNQPPLAPSAWLFPVVWTILYLLMGISSYLIINSDAPKTDIREAIRIYVYQLMVNFLWPTFFFNFGWYLFAFLWLLLLWVLVLIMIVKFKDISKLAAYMNIPYLLWLTFAAYLNFAIWLLN